jgi:hypothetical protein
MGSYGSEVIQCPFYLRHDGKTCKLSCEGMLPGSSVTSHFLDGTALKGQIRKYCAGDYAGCPWERVLMTKYD